MRRLFADTSYWIALFNPQDEWSKGAVRATQSLGEEVHLVTTQDVLTEFLNFFASAGPMLRRHVAEAIREIMTAGDVTVLAQTPESFLAGLELYESDPTATHTDCISRRAMSDEGIEEVLTADARFERKGVRVVA
jgi:predicted nucleic acid-binding protein